MPGPGGISSNPPVNTGFTPTQGAGQAKAPGMEHIENLVLGGQSRTAQAQPPGKSIIDTMGAAFKAMGDVVSNFFKVLGDRMPTIELPSLPRISLRRQEAAQASPAPERAQMKGQLAAQLFQLENSLYGPGALEKRIGRSEKLAILVAPPANSALGKILTEHSAKNQDLANLNFVRGLGAGISLGELREKYIRAEAAQIPGAGGFGMQQAIVSSGGADASLNLDSRLRAPLMASLDKAIAAGLSDVQVVATFNSETKNFEVTIEGSVPDPEMQSLMDGLQKNMQKAHSHVTAELCGNSFGPSIISNSLFHKNNAIMNEARNVKSEGVIATQNRNDAAQAEIGKLNAMSTLEFSQALQADPSLARHLPQMNPSSPARQEYENFVASQQPASREAAVQGFFKMVKASVINESLVESGLVKGKRSDDTVAEPDFSAILGTGSTGAAPAGASLVLPQVALSSLSHLVPLSAEAVQQGKTMEGLQAHMRNVEYNVENLDFLATGTALLRFENALGQEVPANFAVGKPGAARLSLNVDLQAVKQWAERFVGDDAPSQANLPGPQATALQQAVNSMPDDAALATEAQRSELTTAMANCLATVASSVNFDIRPRYEAA